MRSIVYLASPYSHENQLMRQERFHAVCRAAARFMADGHLIFSPIAHTHPIAIEGSLPTDWGFWQRYDEAMLEACAELWVLKLPGWEKSTGVAAEIAIMERLGKPVRFVEMPEGQE